MYLRHMHALVVEGDGGTGHRELRVIVSDMRPMTKDTHSTPTKLEAATLHHINKGLSPLSSHSSHLRGEVVHINAVVALRFRRQAEIGGCVVQARTYRVCICASCQLRRVTGSTPRTCGSIVHSEKILSVLVVLCLITISFFCARNRKALGTCSSSALLLTIASRIRASSAAISFC